VLEKSSSAGTRRTTRPPHGEAGGRCGVGMPMASAAKVRCPDAAAESSCHLLCPLRLLGLAPVRLIVIDVVVRSNGDNELAMGADVGAGVAGCGCGGCLAAAGVGTTIVFTLKTSCLMIERI